ncbi:hypothetical protein T439DRAFT_292360 [Meredithblackwellia eburnea MCA 4105]
MTSIHSANSSTATASALPTRSHSRNGGSYSSASSSSAAIRPLMDRQPSQISTISDNGSTTSMPVATNSALNKVGSASSSLYQNCRAVLKRLNRVPGFSERFLTPQAIEAGGGPSSDQSAAAAQVSSDPVSRSLHALRLGSSLCFLFNALNLSKQLDVNPLATMTNLKACQRGTAHFVMACKQDLGWPDTDLFAIHELYGQDTNGVVKVIHTVTKLLDKLEQSGFLDPETAPADPVPSNLPNDERSMVVKEILDSERKYVQDLEVLQVGLAASGVITQDQIHNLFLNLNSLADFQRRFLIGVEANASLPPEQQHFGLLFLTMEDNFSVYEPYCANLTAAQELAIGENTALSQLKDVLDPVSELSPLLIKPVQRICKYPLLLSTLIKNTPPDTPGYKELVDGHASIERVTAKVNETTRREDNRLSVLDLQRRVEDWKGHDITSFGDLLLRETFFVIKSDSEREYNVYLFERIILCCKETGMSGKKSSKSNSILKRPASRRVANLQLKGRIFVNNVTSAHNVSRNVRSRLPGQYLLEVRWRGDVAEEAFTIKCRTEELLKQWQRMIMKAVEEAPQNRRRTHHLSSRQSNRGINSPLSQFPGTPLSEAGPSSAASIHSHYSEASGYSPYPPSQANMAQPSYPPNSNGFDDEDADGYDIPESGRSTPSNLGSRRGPTTRSLPPGEKEDRSSSSRPRAQTEDSSSAVINQWRNQTPTGDYPPVPRGASHSSQASESHSLRSSASSRQLRGKQSQEWAGNSQGSNGTYSSGHTASPGPSYARLPTSHVHGQEEEMNTPRPGGLARGTSLANTHHHQQQQGYPQPPPMRNRSASSPNIYQVSPNPNGTHSDEWNNPYGGVAGQGHPHHQQQPQVPSVPPLTMSHKSGGTNSAGTLASASSASTGNKKRFSSSSNGTDRSSGTSSQSAGQTHTAATSPATTLPPSAGLPPLPNGAAYGGVNNYNPLQSATAVAVRVKVTYGEDTFVVVVLSSVSHQELVEKVLKKIRMCGDRSHVDANSLRLRYQDEDGDRILITSEEDVMMAFETLRTTGASGTQTLVLFATVDPHSY